MELASGELLTSDGFIDGHVEFESGVVIRVGEGTSKMATAKGVIVPTLINCHTHIADMWSRWTLGFFGRFGGPARTG